MRFYFLITSIFISNLYLSEINNNDIRIPYISSRNLPNPLDDRAKGYLLKGSAQTAITNYGEFIDGDHHPAGLWNNYTYLPTVAFMAGVPGHSYSYKYEWFKFPEEGCPESTGDYDIWCSLEAYSDPGNIHQGFSWYENGDTNFVNVVFETQNDDGILGEKLTSPCVFNNINQWCLHEEDNIVLISLHQGTDPNVSNVYNGVHNEKKGVGLVYPWAIRPDLLYRDSGVDYYNYGEDQESWTDDDAYDYYGFNVAESHFTRLNPGSNTDWQAVSYASSNTHNTFVNENDIFGNYDYLGLDNYPLLAHSEYPETWPNDGVWPGPWAENFNPIDTNCNPPYRYNDDCWETVEGRFISDMDIYMEFDDRWAHMGNIITNDEYQQTGYPMGLKVLATAHSYGDRSKEDILFFTINVRNESGDWCAFERDKNGDKVWLYDENGNPICDEAMTMPDGSKLNKGRGFDYKDVFLGFNLNADVVLADKFGNMGVHTNDDDFMEYYDCKNPDIVPEGCEVINDDTLRVSIAMIYDYDGVSGAANDIGIVATQLLDSPYATEEVDLNGDGYADLYPGDKLKMTNWHWYDWYNRPGVIYREGDAGCCAGDIDEDQARNKEEIMYKVMSGDTTNLSDDERAWFFHTDSPSTDDHENNLNPHFDSLNGLELTEFFQADPPGLDCVLEMSTGPVSLEVGEQVPLSFTIIFGENKNDLIENATFAQLMYNSHYQGYTAPDTPVLTATTGEDNLNEEWYQDQHHTIKLSWDNSAEKSTDVVTGYADFEGYKLYKSDDGGETWGDPNTDRLFDPNGAVVGWYPYAQFHLSAEKDSLRCTFSNDFHGQCTISKPEFYVERGCFEPEIVNGIEYSPICGVSDCNDYSWLNCVRSNCNQISNQAYLNLLENDQLNYLPFYSYTVDCNDPLWGGNGFGDPEIRGFNVCGEDQHIPYMGNHALGACSDDSGLKYTFIDSNVIDGYEYTYTLTAYDMGISPPYINMYNEDLGILTQDINSSNPLGYAEPDGYQFLESGIGRSLNDNNYVTVIAGVGTINYMFGDANEDGTLNVLDIIVIVDIIFDNYFGGENPSATILYVSDLNQDDTIDISDVILLINYILDI